MAATETTHQRARRVGESSHAQEAGRNAAEAPHWDFAATARARDGDRACAGSGQTSRLTHERLRRTIAKALSPQPTFANDVFLCRHEKERRWGCAQEQWSP